MKILYHHRTRSKDGQYVHIEEMVGALRSLGHEVCIVAPAGAEDEAFGADAGMVAWLKRHMPKFAYEIAELAYSLVAYRQLAVAVRHFQPDCLYERYNLFLPAGVWISRRFKLPMLLEVNAPLLDERSRYDGLALTRLARWSEGYAWRNADRVLPVTQVMADIVATYGVAPERMQVIPNGINSERFKPSSIAAAKTALGLESSLVLGFTGFVRDWHGLDKVIDMIAGDAPDAGRTLLIVGDGPARAGLEQQASRLRISHRVRFTGLVERDDVARHVAAFDIALQPAVVSYASPLKLFEYLALGKAIIGPAQPNIEEILRDGYNAVLFDPADPHAMPQAISRLCEDKALRVHVAENARRTIDEQQLTWVGNARKVVALFQTLQKN